MADETKVVLTADTSQYERNVDGAARSTDAMLASVVKLTTAIDGAFKSAGRKLEFGGVGALAGISAMAVQAGRLDEQMSQLQASMTMVSKSQVDYDRRMKDTSKTVSDLRSNFGQTAQEAIALATQLNKLGQTTGQVNSLADSFTRLSAISGENINGLVDGMVSLQRQMGTQGIQQTKVFNATLAELSANSGASAQGILNFSQSIAPVAKISGMTQKEIMGVSTAFVKSGADGFAAANAFNKMLTDITRSIQYGSPELKAYSNLIGKSVDEFKSMNRTEAITQIFEQINQQGPEAIKTLNRFGLDGIRTYKSLQAVANQGGIRQAVSDAMGGGNQDKFNAASNQAFDGLNDELKKMSENGKQIAEAFGKGVLPIFEKFAKLVNAVLSPVKGLLQEMDKIPGLATAALGLGAIGAGMVVKSFTGLSALGPAVGAFRTVRGGFRSTRNDYGDLSDRERTALANQQRWMMGQPAPGNFIQHRMYQGAQWLGYNARTSAEARASRIAALRAADPNYDSRSMAGRAASRVGIFSAQMVGGFARAGLDPLSIRAVGNNFNRDQNLQMFRSARFRDTAGISQAQYQWNRFRGMLGNKEAAAAAASAARLNTSLNTAANSATQYSTVTQALRGETLALAKAMGSAAAGTTMLAGRGAMTMAGNAVSPLWSGVKGLAAGIGPLGWLMMAGMGAGYLNSKSNEFQDSMLASATNPENNSPSATYAAALGEATKATMTFADAVKAQANKIGGAPFSNKVTDEEASRAQADKGKFTYSGMQGASENEARAIVTAMRSGNPSDGQLQLVKGDLLKNFGTSAQGRATVERILAASGDGSRIDLTPLFDRTYQSAGLTTLNDQTKANELAQSTGSQIQEMLVNRTPVEANQIAISALNQASSSVRKTGFWGQSKGTGITAIATSYVRGILGESATEDDIQAVTEALVNGRSGTEVQSILRRSNTAIGRYVGMASGDIGNMLPDATTVPSSRSYQNTWDGAGVDRYVMNKLRGSSSLVGTTMTRSQNAIDSLMNSVAGTGPRPRADLSVEPNRTDSFANRIFSGDPSSNANSQAIYNALTNEGSTNAQWAGMKALSDEALRAKGSFSGAIEAIDSIKSAAGDSSTALYQLAASAQGNVRQRQAEAMAYMSTPQRAAELRGNYDASMRSYLNNPNSESGETLEKDRQAMVGLQQETYGRMKSLMTQVREFNVSTSRAEEDFARQRTYNEEDFARSQKYALEDYNRSREFAEEDFQRSRRRNEEDFNHQVVVMARNAAKSVMNIYERINVQRTWSASNLLENMRDQQARLAEQQANLARLRRAGLSGDAINQLGLNDPQNAQQLARLTDDIVNDPGMIDQFNSQVRKRLKAARKVVTDQDNEQWKEMRRSFALNVSRSQDDFDRAQARQAQQFGIGLKRQADQFALSMDRMQDQYKLSMNRARDDLNRSQEEITGTFEELAEASLKTLTGTSRSQLATLLAELGYVRGKVLDMSRGLMSDLQKIFAQLGIDTSTGTPMIGGRKLMTGTVVLPNGTKINAGQFAAGGEIPGYSPHAKADNIPIMATAGEFMQPVDSVKHYGRDFMEKIRTKSIPKDAVQHLASGGMVYQQMGDWVRKNLPGVQITSSYRPGAITALGNVSMHAQGKALDLAPSMSTFDKIRSTFGSSIYQLFYSPADGRTILRGKPWRMDPVTKGDHWDHVHWAMEQFTKGDAAKLGGWDGDPKSIIKMMRKISSVSRFDKLMSQSIKPLQALGNNFMGNAMAQYALSQLMGETQAGTDRDYSSVTAGNESLKGMVRSMAAQRGWTGGNWTALDQLVSHESSWNPRAQNPGSTAYGLFQFLDSTWKGVGGHKTSDPKLQAKYGLQYIANRYGNPSKAWDFWQAQSPHWYGDGAVFNKAQQIGVGERGPEAVIPLNQRGVDFVYELMKKNTADSRRALAAAGGVPAQASTTNYYSRVDKSTTFTGDIKVEANDPNEFLRKIEEKKRMDALKGRGR